MLPNKLYIPIGLILIYLQFSSSLSTIPATTIYAQASSAFHNRDAAKSLALYDSLPPSPFLWQRGLSAYCAGEYSVAESQFHLDTSVNGDDGEETIWEYLSSRKAGSERSGDILLRVIDGTGKVNIPDKRDVIRQTLLLFYLYTSSSSSSKTKEAAIKSFVTRFHGSSDRERFYSSMYLALLYSAEGEDSLAKLNFNEALRTSYSSTSKDTMVDVVRNLNIT